MSQSNSTRQQATALKYALDKENSAPMVVASGMGHVAQKIVEVATENNIPIYEDDSLASLLSQLQVGSQIPQELFQTVVDIYVYFLQFTPDKRVKMQDARGVQDARGKMQESQDARGKMQEARDGGFSIDS